MHLLAATRAGAGPRRRPAARRRGARHSRRGRASGPRDAADRQLGQGGAHRGVGSKAHRRRQARTRRQGAPRAARAGHAHGDGSADRRFLLSDWTSDGMTAAAELQSHDGGGHSMSEPSTPPTLSHGALQGVTQVEIDQRVFDLYDEYCHGDIDRRQFLQRAAALTIGGVSALAMAQSLLPRYAEAQTISFTDPRIKALYV